MSATESDPEWDPKWEHCETDRFQSIEADIVAVIIRHAKMKDLARNQGTILMNANKDKVVMNKGHAEDTPCKNCCKCKMSDKENSDTWTTKKSRVSIQIYMTSFTYRVRTFVKKGTDIHIKFHEGKKRSSMRISIEIST